MAIDLRLFDAVCPLYTDNWATLAMAAAWLAKARDPTEVITRLFPAPEPAQLTRTEQVMCPDTAPPARARAARRPHRLMRPALHSVATATPPHGRGRTRS